MPIVALGSVYRGKVGKEFAHLRGDVFAGLDTIVEENPDDEYGDDDDTPYHTRYFLLQIYGKAPEEPWSRDMNFLTASQESSQEQRIPSDLPGRLFFELSAAGVGDEYRIIHGMERPKNRDTETLATMLMEQSSRLFTGSGSGTVYPVTIDYRTTLKRRIQQAGLANGRPVWRSKWTLRRDPALGGAPSGVAHFQCVLVPGFRSLKEVDAILGRTGLRVATVDELVAFAAQHPQAVAAGFTAFGSETTIKDSSYNPQLYRHEGILKLRLAYCLGDLVPYDVLLAVVLGQ